MDNAIHWSQTLNAYWCAIAFMVALVLVVALVVEKEDHRRKGKKPIALDKFLILSFILFSVPQGIFFTRAYVDANTGNQYKDDLMRWQQEADALPGLSLRPEMAEMLVYLEENTGGVASLKGIKGALHQDLMVDNYLSFVEYGQFKDFLDECYTGPSALSFESVFSDRYPISHGNLKGYLKTLVGKNQLEKTCEMAVPLIILG